MGHEKLLRRVTNMALVLLLLVGLAVVPASTASSASERTVRLLFVHSPGCPHCAYQRPIVREFEQSHPEVGVTWVRYGELNREQRRLIEGTSGHPVMVFHNGKCIRQVVGETARGDLEKEYDTFKKDLKNCLQAGNEKKTTTGSQIICR